MKQKKYREAAADYAPRIDYQTWTCHNTDFDEVVAVGEKHGIRHHRAIGSYINPMGLLKEARQKKAVLNLRASKMQFSISKALRL